MGIATTYLKDIGGLRAISVLPAVRSHLDMAGRYESDVINLDDVYCDRKIL